MTDATDLLKRIQALDGNNYRDWSFDMEMFLRLQKLWDVIEVESPTDEKKRAIWHEKDGRALSYITSKLMLSEQEQIRDFKTAKDAWKNLEKIYERKEANIMLDHYKQELKKEKEAHASTKAELKKEKEAHASTKAELKKEKEVYVFTKVELKKEKETHTSTKAELKKEKESHASTMAELKKEKEAYASIKVEFKKEKEAHASTKAALKKEKASHESTKNELAKERNTLF